MHHAKCWMGWITTWNQDFHLFLGRKARTNLNSVLKCKDIKKKKTQRHHFADKSPYSQSYVFSSRHVCIWEWDQKEIWGLKNWCIWTVVMEKTLESLLDCREVKPVNYKGNKSRIFIGRTDIETEALTLATICEEFIHWKRHWCKRFKSKGKENGRVWDG